MKKASTLLHPDASKLMPAARAARASIIAGAGLLRTTEVTPCATSDRWKMAVLLPGPHTDGVLRCVCFISYLEKGSDFQHAVHIYLATLDFQRMHRFLVERLCVACHFSRAKPPKPRDFCAISATDIRTWPVLSMLSW